MPLRRGTPLTFRPFGVTDSVDGSNARPGSCASLANLIPDPSTMGVFVPRPAAVQKTGFSGFASPGQVSCLLVVGNLAYGLVATIRNPGNDEPFLYNLATNTFLPVAGVSLANTPASPAASGDWTPPIIAQVGSRIVVTHPGFAGGAVKFGWFDVSGFAEAATGNTHSNTTIDGNVSILGVQPGMSVNGPGIAAGTSVVATATVAIATTGTTHSNTTLDGIPSTAGMAAGQPITGAPALGIPAGTTIAAVVSGVAVTLNHAATAGATGAIATSGTTITLNQAATATADAVALTIAGGTTAAPLWGAGDTDRNPLPSVPVGVAQFNARAYFACGTDGIVFSDSGFPCRVSNNPAVQALTTNDGLAVTAVGPLQLSAPLTGGIVQALIAFEGAAKMQQITGDMTAGTLSMNALPVATGTLAPLSITPCELGLGFVSPEGLRFVKFDGTVSPPVGDAGSGVTVPFINSLAPSRICAAANAHTIRIATQRGDLGGAPQQEWWHDLGRQCWTGPMSLVPALVQPWGTGFLVAPQGLPATLWQSDSVTTLASVYTENGQPMAWTYQTAPLPDTDALAENALVDMTLAAQIPAGTVIALTASDISGASLDSTTIPSSGTLTTWGSFTWGSAPWGGSLTNYQQLPVNWNGPLVFKQLVVAISAPSAQNTRIGNLYMRYQTLGYKLQAA